jgi:hypothetical protein
MNEILVVEFTAPYQVVPRRDLLHRLGLALLEVVPGKVILIKVATQADACWGLRVRELVRRLGQEVAAVRLE